MVKSKLVTAQGPKYRFFVAVTRFTPGTMGINEKQIWKNAQGDDTVHEMWFMIDLETGEGHSTPEGWGKETPHGEDIRAVDHRAVHQYIIDHWPEIPAGGCYLNINSGKVHKNRLAL